MHRYIMLLAGPLLASPAFVLGLSPPYTTPAPDPECHLSDPAMACPTYAHCYASDSGCSSSGCDGFCAPTSSCTIGSPNRTCSDASNVCTPFYTDCTTTGCFGACITTTTVSPTGPTDSGSACKIDDPTSSCNQTPYSSCAGSQGCTTSGCEGTCTLRQICSPTNSMAYISSSVVIPLPSTAASACPTGEKCSVHSGTPFCYTVSATSQPESTTMCLTSSSSSSSTYLPTLPCVLGGEKGTECPKCHACVAFSGDCSTAGCMGDCLPVPCATTQSSSSEGGYGGPSCTIGGTECGGRCFTCIDLSNECTTAGCIGECLGLPCASPTDDLDDSAATSPSGGLETTSPFPDPVEPPLKTRTYDCLVSVTSECGIGQQCEPYYGPCCDSLNCPGKCVDIPGSSSGCATQVEVTRTVTVYTTML